MATARVPARRTTAKTSPFEVLTEIDDDGNFEASIFGERFKLSSDVNGWLLFLAGAGRARDVINLVESILVVEEVDGEKVDVTREKERQRFHGILSQQRNFSVEDAIELVNAMTEVAAGNDSSASSSG